MVDLNNHGPLIPINVISRLMAMTYCLIKMSDWTNVLGFT